MQVLQKQGALTPNKKFSHQTLALGVVFEVGANPFPRLGLIRPIRPPFALYLLLCDISAILKRGLHYYLIKAVAVRKVAWVWPAIS